MRDRGRRACGGAGGVLVCACALAVAGAGFSAAPDEKSSQPIADASIVLRAGLPNLGGKVLSVSASGATLRIIKTDQTTAEVIVSLDLLRDIAEVMRDQKLTDQQRADVIAIAAPLWRARTRLERGDYERAEEVLEALYVAMAGKSLIAGPTGAVLCEGVLRCRLNRGATSAALEPWLRWRAIEADAGRVIGESPEKAGPVWMGGVIAGGNVTDAATGLCVQLPPIFSIQSSPRALPMLAASSVWSIPALNTPAGAATGRMAALYRAAINAEIALKAGKELPSLTEETLTAKEPSLAFIGEIVLSRAGNPAQRQNARGALERRLSLFTMKPRPGDAEAEARQIAVSSSAVAWQEAWIRAAIGRSLLLESDAKLRRQGLVSLLHVPARFGDTQPWLAALCLSDAIAELKASGDVEGARKLAQELQSRLGDYTTDETADLARPDTPPPAALPGGAGDTTGNNEKDTPAPP